MPAWSFAKKRPEATDGLHRVIEGGWRWTARYPYAATQTAPGHAALGTGASPSVTGILGNDWWRRELGREAKAAEPPDGGAPSSAMLRVDGIADQLAREHPEARAISLALKDRSALLTLGHTGVSVWYDIACACLQANTAEQPAWLASLPAVTPRLDVPWTPSDPARLERLSGGPDDAPGELGVAGWGPTFPHEYTADAEPAHKVMDSPLGNQILVEAALAAIDGEQLGTRYPADYLVISFSAHDYVGHAWGQDSWESWDTWLRLDEQLGALVRGLDERIPGYWAMVITADHGAPELAERRGIPSYRISYEDVERVAEEAAARVAGAGDWIAAARFPTVFLTDAANARPDRDAIIDAIVEALEVMEGLERADRTADFVGDCDAKLDDASRAICLSLDAERSGEVFYTPAVGTTLDKIDSHDAVSHGSLHDDDREVPVVVFAPRIKPGETDEVVDALRIAPTIAELLDISPPPAATGPSLLSLGPL